MKVPRLIIYTKSILSINELNTTAESTPIMLKTTTPKASLTPNPEIPMGNANKTIMDNNEYTKNTFIGSMYCPNDKNNRKNNNASKNIFTKVTNVLYPK